jgi:general secretion pathway protein C
MGEAVIEEILWRKVLIRKDGELQAIPMDATAIMAKPKGQAPKGDVDGEGIEKTDEDQYTVPQSVVDNALEDLDKMASQVRVRPHRDSDGNVDGYRLSAIRRGTLLDKLGIKNGDIVHEVNGYSLNSSSGAMTAFQSLQSESAFQFDISRRNKRRAIKYDIR